MEYVTVYDRQGKMLAVLENAMNVGYELKHNDLWTATFSLPAADPKNEYCQARNWARIPDGERSTGIYRIVGMPDSDETAQGGTKAYQLEHVMATLLDDVLFGYHEVGGEEFYTEDVIRYILAQQETPRWQLGVCEFADEYQYHFENCSLLAALMSLGQVLTEEYTWVFDTDTEPWTVSLKRADQEAGCGIHYGRNLKYINKTMDCSALFTRLYPLGYGEGVNQLRISGVNNGVPYIEADTAAIWGVVSNVWTDTRIQDAGILLARARQILEAYKNPYLSYTAKAVDLYRQTGMRWDNVMPGRLVRVMDSEHNLSFDARVVSVAKGDVYGDPGDMEIVIANAPRDTADAVNTLADKVGIGELYSQGATNLFAQTFSDNADATHPAVMRFYVPQSLIRINSLLLSWQLGKFRAYSTGAKAGGGGSSTSESGGGAVATTVSAGECTVYTAQTVRSATGSLSFQEDTEYASGSGSHKHTLKVQNVPFGVSVTIPALEIRVPDHDHSVSIPAHRHTVSMPAHSHGIVYGIYEGGQAHSVSILVDGNQVPAEAIGYGELDVTAWMDKDEDGRVTRGRWHEIQIVPDALTRIEGALFAQCFVQSVGGGDY